MTSLILSDSDKLIFETASSTKGLGGLAAKSAIRHLERAYQLVNEMPEVAAFLAVTAQEESAVCVFHGLKKKSL